LARFPESAREVQAAAVEYVAQPLREGTFFDRAETVPPSLPPRSEGGDGAGVELGVPQDVQQADGAPAPLDLALDGDQGSGSDEIGHHSARSVGKSRAGFSPRSVRPVP
jgi:hypothetical protein